MSTSGTQRGNLLIQLMLAGGGLVVARIDYFVLHPTPMLATLSWESVWLPILRLGTLEGAINLWLIATGLLGVTA